MTDHAGSGGQAAVDAGVDRSRLEALLGGDDLAWLRTRVRQRVERGVDVGGVVRLADPSPAQRAAVDRLLGRRPSVGAQLAASLDAVDRLLRDAQVCDGLVTAVEVLDGPVRNRRAERQAVDAAWLRLFDEARAAVQAATDDEPTWAVAWLDELAATGLLRRLTADPDHARALLGQARAVLAALPARGVSTAGLAAAVVGDSHGLDDGRPLTTLVLKGVQHRSGVADTGPLPTGEERRALWASVGVLGDELSSTVLAAGLHRRPSPGVDRPTIGGRQRGGASLTDTVVDLHGAAGEPIRLTLSQLVRHPPDLGHLRGMTVFICENPAVVAAATRRLGNTCAPVLCVEGQPSAAAQLLLGRLADGGARLAYHGDFDWPGLRIGRVVIARFGAAPWRFTASDYRRAPAGPPLRGTPATAPWDPGLPTAMTARGIAVHEEQVLDELLSDLARPAAPAPPWRGSTNSGHW
jgi:uncharacterized protein (TIGR02679 family)